MGSRSELLWVSRPSHSNRSGLWFMIKWIKVAQTKHKMSGSRSKVSLEDILRLFWRPCRTSKPPAVTAYRYATRQTVKDTASWQPGRRDLCCSKICAATCLCLSAYLSTYLSTHPSIYLFISLYLYLCTYTPIDMYIYIYTCTQYIYIYL